MKNRFHFAGAGNVSTGVVTCGIRVGGPRVLPPVLAIILNAKAQKCKDAKWIGFLKAATCAVNAPGRFQGAFTRHWSAGRPKAFNGLLTPALATRSNYRFSDCVSPTQEVAWV
jgi:hypothetical protein